MSVEKVGWLSDAEARPEGYYINGEKVKGATLSAEDCDKWNRPDTVNLPSGKAVTAAEHEQMLHDMQAAGAAETQASTPMMMPEYISEADALAGSPMPVITLDDMVDGAVTLDELDLDDPMEMGIVTLDDDTEIDMPMEMLTEAPVTMADLQRMSKVELEELGREHGVELDRREKKSSLIEEIKGVLGM